MNLLQQQCTTESATVPVPTVPPVVSMPTLHATITATTILHNDAVATTTTAPSTNLANTSAKYKVKYLNTDRNTFRGQKSFF